MSRVNESESLWDLALILESRSRARAPGLKYLWRDEASVLFAKALMALMRERERQWARKGTAEYFNGVEG